MFAKPIIKQSSDIRTNYNSISKLAKESGTPVYITKNGSGDTVLMDIDAFSKREIELDLRQQKLDDAEKALRTKLRFSSGNKGIPVEKSRQRTLEMLKDTAQQGTSE